MELTNQSDRVASPVAPHAQVAAQVQQLLNQHEGAKGWRFKIQSSVGEPNGSVGMEGSWGYAGRWSDYALDFYDPEEDDPDEVEDEIIEERVMTEIRKQVVAALFPHFVVHDLYLDDGGFSLQVVRGS